jgi:hypothetical protein
MAKKKIVRVATNEGAKGYSSESAKQALAEHRQLMSELEKLRNGRPKIEMSEEEKEWRWRQLMRHGRFLDDC